MNITFIAPSAQHPKGLLSIDEARIVFRNFSGVENRYNAKGNRNFSVVIENEEQEMALREEHWNVKTKPSRSDPDDVFRYLPVKINYNYRAPHVYLNKNGKRQPLSQEDIGLIDTEDIIYVNLDLRPSDWNVNGKTGRAAYLDGIEVFCSSSRFDREYANNDEEDQRPF